MKLLGRVLLLAGGGFVVGFLLAIWAVVALWWGFPGDWQPLSGLPEAPQQLLALDPEEGTFLLRTAAGGLFTCRGPDCTPAAVDWSSETTRCDRAHRSAVVSLFPVLLSRRIRGVWACELGYQSTARTIYLLRLADGGSWLSTGAGLLLVDAIVLGAGLVGGLVGLAAALVLGLALAGVRAMRRRKPRLDRRASGPKPAARQEDR